MRFADLLRSSLGNLWQRKFRTSLTITGVVVGTMAVVVMVSLGVGMSQAQLESLESYANLRQITVYGPPNANGSDSGRGRAPGNSSATPMDDEFLAQLAELPGVVQAWGIYSVPAQITTGGTTMQVQLTGVPHEMLAALDVDYSYGGVPAEHAPLGLVVGDKVGEMYAYDPETGEALDPVDFSATPSFISFPAQEQNPTGGPGRVPAGVAGGQTQEADSSVAPPKKFLVPTAAVIAGVEGQWGRYSSEIYVDRDALVRTLEKAFPGKALPGQPTGANGAPRGGLVYSQIVLQTVDIPAAEQLTTQLNLEGYQFSSDIEWMRQSQQQATLIQAVLGGIGFISLLVAAIGIANTMLMSVYERTREIGIMKVLGAALGDIRRMFLVESASIGFFGGLFGLLLSLGISTVINIVVSGMMSGPGMVAPQISVIPVWLMLGAVGFATAIGTVAGIVPAQRAMRLSALSAIRGQ